MLKSRFGDTNFHYLICVGYAGLAVGLPLSKALLSISLVFLILLFLLNGQYKESFRKIKAQPILLLLLAFLAIHLLSFLWSDDLAFAMKDLKNKIPLYLLPFFLVIHPLRNKNESNWILGLFVFSVTLTSVINYGSYQFGWLNMSYSDIRGLSLFISHIRYALMVAFATSIAWVYARNTKSSSRYLAFILIAWLIYYTYYSQVLSGVLVLGGVFVFILIHEMIQRKNKLISALILTFLIGLGSLFIFGIWFLFQKQELKIALTNLPEKTKEGNLYKHQINPMVLENGYPLYCFISEKELEREWNKRSDIPYDSLDKQSQLMKGTLIRFLTSKGLNKDAEGISKLSAEEIKHIENGIPSILALNQGFVGRLYVLKYELFNNDNPNGQSVSQRLIYWKTGFKIAKKDWFFGIGSGDIQQAFQHQYEVDNSPLEMNNRNRTHNQFLTYFITFGVLGFVLFLAILFKSWKCFNTQNNLLALLFLIISMLSFLVEDTLETQMGVTFFAFFLGFFISQEKEKTLSNN